eukprot:gnl/MRDRNA2_/MRDRNA2_72375_c0_seq1.p1 gnl/MRDRNA2_/MRDRNA2_72375_c0~~gnl/MRDRNA2_/MRDRNA2_72375_c0_seq1.p1  ORF type:complete len:313 (-),score=59.91 gnl/MRDRNA2_/MRDRNA2_72375_c0_seq1:67-1005(-)
MSHFVHAPEARDLRTPDAFSEKNLDSFNQESLKTTHRSQEDHYEGLSTADTLPLQHLSDADENNDEDDDDESDSGAFDQDEEVYGNEGISPITFDQKSPSDDFTSELASETFLSLSSEEISGSGSRDEESDEGPEAPLSENARLPVVIRASVREGSRFGTSTVDNQNVDNRPSGRPAFHFGQEPLPQDWRPSFMFDSDEESHQDWRPSFDQDNQGAPFEHDFFQRGRQTFGKGAVEDLDPILSKCERPPLVEGVSDLNNARQYAFIRPIRTGAQDPEPPMSLWYTDHNGTALPVHESHRIATLLHWGGDRLS